MAGLGQGPWLQPSERRIFGAAPVAAARMIATMAITMGMQQISMAQPLWPLWPPW